MEGRMSRMHPASAALEFALRYISDPFERTAFLQCWSDGDVSPWPEYAGWVHANYHNGVLALRQTQRKDDTAITEIAAERSRQVEVEGWTLEHDDAHDSGELADAAACYALGRKMPSIWPWAEEWWKPSDRRRNLIKAGALIVAEIERLDRAEKSA
jgi:hypothetical protein